MPGYRAGMRLFTCPSCRHLVEFEAAACLNCGTQIAYDPDAGRFERARARCVNVELAACNWLPAADGELCASCVLTRTRPADGDLPGLAAFALVEGAKRRLLFGLADLGLPLRPWFDGEGGLGFDLLSSAQAPVVTGHANGIVTIDLAEADPAHRERMRIQLGEFYRTVLGHLRHEVGHWYFTVLVREGTPEMEACRRLFGDERADYQAALDRHYREGGSAGWAQTFVSSYATMHPAEDWAETFAHYLHIRDTLQTANEWGVRFDGPAIAVADDDAALEAEPVPADSDLGRALAAWVPLTLALNAINRSMDVDDLYPFVLSTAVRRKLAVVDALVRGW